VSDERYRRGSVLLELSVVTALLGRLFERESERLGLRPTQGAVLALVHIHGPATPSALERESGLPGTTLRERLQPLLDTGLVQRIPNESDRRSYFLDTTPAGERALDAAVPAMRAVEEELERELGEPMESLRPQLERIRAAALALLGS
jgi:DNA-binding MarR family transcriptional regulator